MAKRLLIYFPGIYMVLTIVIYALSPWEFDKVDDVYSYYLTFVVIAVWFGSVLGSRSSASDGDGGGAHYSNSARRLFLMSLWISYILYLPTVYARTGKPYPDVLWSLNHGSEAYGRATQSVFPQIEYLRILFAPFLIGLIPLKFSVNESLSSREKGAFWMFIVLNSLMFVSMGVNRGIFESIFGIGFCATMDRLRSGQRLWRLSSARILMILAIGVTGALFFAEGQLNRSGSGALTGYFPAANASSVLNPSEAESEFTKYLWVVINQFSIYITQGYYLGGEIFSSNNTQGTFGFGYSDFLLRNAATMLGGDFLMQSPIYAFESNHEWIHGNYWFSIIPWFASDVGYIGAAVVLLIFAVIYSRAVRCFMRQGSAIDLVVAYLLFFLFFYSSANNYIFQSGDMFFGTWVFLIYWIILQFKHRG